MKVLCKVNCFYSKDVERYDANHVYDIDDKKMKDFEKSGFAKYFEPIVGEPLVESKKEAAK
jgi:hypothetical protein